jgi:TolB-like protein/Tfp pilus assembly protein PilF
MSLRVPRSPEGLPGDPGRAGRAGSEDVPQRSAGWLRVGAGVLALGAIAACAAYAWHLHRRGYVESIVVLPFIDITPEKNQEWLADGVAEGIIDSLTRVPGLRVAGRTSAFYFENKPQDIRRIADQLAVSAVLTGSVRYSADRVRVTVELNRPADGYRFWSHTFDRPVRDVLSIEHEIAGDITRLVRNAKDGQKPPRRQPTPQAYSAYLEGRYLFRRGDVESLRRAIERFVQATDADPQYAPAWAWLSIAQEYLVETGSARPNEVMPGARDAAERAVALDADAGESHAALGIVKLQYDWDWDEAKREFDRALELSPGSAFIRSWRGHWFESQGKRDEALAEMQKALEVDPLSALILADISAAYRYLGQSDLAIQFAQKSVDLYPDAAIARIALLRALTAAGQMEKSRAALREFEASPLRADATPRMTAELTALSGDIGRADAMLENASEIRTKNYIPAFGYALVSAAIHETASAFAWLDAAYDERSVQMPYWRLQVAVPKNDSRYGELEARMNLTGR